MKRGILWECWLLEKILRNVNEGSGQSIISVSKAGDILFVNKISEKLLGLKGKKLHEVLPTPLADSMKSKIEKVIQTRKSEIVENESQVNGGEIKWFEWRIHPIFNNGFNIDSVFVISMDITERKSAEAKLKQSYERLQKTLKGVVNALTSTIEIRDPYTAGHQRRVSELACLIAEEMNLSPDKIEGIRIASLVHDIGKIYVPTEILSKPGTLTESEFNLIKIHPQAGYDILKSIDFPWPIAETILQHHERIDGSGYPKGTKGNEIIIEAKILSVADVLESMASHRPYRPAKGLKLAIAELVSNKGKYYDPHIVDICLKLYKEKKMKFLSE